MELAQDYGDLEEKLEYYKIHTKEALEIIENAHNYCTQFKDTQKELILNLLVLHKYLALSGQIEDLENLGI